MLAGTPRIVDIPQTPFTGVGSIASSDTSLTISPSTGAVDAIVNTAHAFNWTAQHTFNSFLPTSSIFPSAPSQFVTKLYVDSFMQGLIPYLQCDCATTANITLSGEQTIDGFITLASRVLVKDQILQKDNGVWISAAGAWTRATDFDVTAEILQGAFFPVTNGTQNGNTRWAQYLFMPSSDTLGVDPIAFTLISQAGIGTVGGTGTDNHIMRWNGTSNAQDSDLEISDVVGGIVTVSTPSALYFTTTTLGYEFQVDSFGSIYLNAGANGNVGGGQGYRVDIRAGQGGPTGLGGPLLLVAGQGGATSGNGGPVQIYGGSSPFGATNSDGGDVWITPGAKTGSGTVGKFRFYNSFGANFGVIFDGSLIDPSGADKTFTFPAISGTFVVSNTTTDDNTIPRYDGTSGKLVQDGELTISDIVFGTVNLQTKTSNFHISPLGDGNELRLFIPNTTAGAAGPINIYGGTGFGAGSGSPIEITGGGGGATGIGGYVAITGGQGGGTSGAGATVSLTGGSASAGNSNGGNVDFYGGLNTGSGVKGHVRILDNPFSTFAAQFDASLIAISTKTFIFPNASGTFALTSNNLGAFGATTSAQLAGIITDETGTGALVFANSPVLVTPNLGTPSAAVLTNATGLPITTGVSGLAAGIATFLSTGANLAVTGLLTSSSPTAGIGYAAGAGGSVTQLTSKATAVTLNRVCGQITTSNANLASNTTVTFTLNNSTIGANDSVVPEIKSGGTIGAYQVWKSSSGAGVCTISIRNITGGPLAQAIVIEFNVTKSVIV